MGGRTLAAKFPTCGTTSTSEKVFSVFKTLACAHERKIARSQYFMGYSPVVIEIHSHSPKKQYLDTYDRWRASVLVAAQLGGQARRECLVTCSWVLNSVGPYASSGCTEAEATHG